MYGITLLVRLAEKRRDVKLEKKYLAYLEDRIRIHEKKPQRFGTQFHNIKDKLVPHPIENPKNVNKRRKALGLEPIEECAEFLQKKYGKKK